MVTLHFHPMNIHPVYYSPLFAARKTDTFKHSPLFTFDRVDVLSQPVETQMQCV